MERYWNIVFGLAKYAKLIVSARSIVLISIAWSILKVTIYDFSSTEISMFAKVFKGLRSKIVCR